MIYSIGNLTFSSQEKAKEYTRNILSKNGANTIINSSHPDFQFFLDLIDNHTKKEKKIGAGIESFYISENERRTGLETSINRIDGTNETFSWNDCAKQSTKTKEQKLDAAFRKAIDEQIQQFRNQTKECCANPSCLKEIKCAVDHKDPTFYEIKMKFQEKNPNIPNEFGKQPGTNEDIFKDSDKDFCLKWQEFHKQSAVLQYLCRTCHEEKTKQDCKKIKLLKSNINRR